MTAPALAAFRRAGVNVDLVTTTAPGHGGQIAQERAEAYDFVFALGGDGTAIEIVQALAGTNRSVGILPGGTGNLLARVLGVPSTIDRAVPALMAGTRSRVDLGMLSTGRAFIVGAGAGIDSAMIEGAPPVLRRKYGLLAYVASATRAIIWREPFAVRAAVDGRVVERDHCVAAMILNIGIVLDGMLHLGPGISHADGELDLCLLSVRRFTDAAEIARRMVMRDFRDDRYTTFVRGRRIALETAPVRRAQADGELIGETPLFAEVLPGVAPLLVPRA
jgi:diacylglycerol kinase (ATP)